MGLQTANKPQLPICSTILKDLLRLRLFVYSRVAKPSVINNSHLLIQVLPFLFVLEVGDELLDGSHYLSVVESVLCKPISDSC